MRSPLAVAVLTLSLLAAVTLLWTWQWAADDSVAPEHIGGTAPAPSTSPSPAAIGAASRGDSALPAGTVALRTAANVPEPGQLADAPTAWLRVVEYGSERPLAGAAVRRVQNGAELAFTDAQGLAPLPLPDAEQLAVVLDGHLLRMAPTRPGSTEREPQVVTLVRDAWSWRRRIRCVRPDGSAAAEAFVRLRPGNGTANVTSPVPAGDAALGRAWSEHTMLAARPVCGDIAVQLGTWSADRVHRLGDGQVVRFLARGSYTIEAATLDGFVGVGTVVVDGEPASTGDAVVTLQPGVFVAGTVVDLGTGTPLPQATVVVQGGEPLGLQATTDAHGAFTLGPLAAGSRTLEVRHGEHEALAHGPIQVPANGLRIPLRALSRTTLRGRVRTLPTLAPIAGASVVWTPPGGAPVVATTDAEGVFTLAATGATDSKLTVTAPRHIVRSELIAPGAPFAEYDLLPADPAVRVQQGLTAQLQGVVLERDGTPRAGASVRWAPNAPTPPNVVPGRRVVDGAVLVLPPVTTTAADGSFTLETTQFGSGTLTSDDVSLRVDAIAGRIRSDLRLQR